MIEVQLQEARRPEFLRAFLDRLLAAILLVLFSPLLLIGAILAKLGSPGPVFFKQIRVGRNGKPFKILKFRTMRVDAERSGPQVTSGSDHRTTKIGRILRAIKLDEYPQLINVVKGEMSLVGPRPQVPRYVDHFTEEDRRIILSVLPGITGSTSLRFRHEEAILERVPNPEEFYIRVLLPIKCRLDVEYVQKRTLMGDAGVLLQTLGLFIRGLGHRLLRRPMGHYILYPVPELEVILDRIEMESKAGEPKSAVISLSAPEVTQQA